MGRRGLTAAIAALVVFGVPSGAQALAPVGSGVVGLWQGEGDATDPFNAHDGSLLGGAGFTLAPSGQSFSFTGSEQAVDIPDSASLYPSGSFTIAGWVRTTETLGQQNLIAHYECGLSCPTGQANSAFGLFIFEGKADGWLRDANAGGPAEEGGQFLPGSGTIADGAEHYLAFERDTAANELRLYVDGALDATATPQEVASGPLENLDGEADDLYLGSFRRCNAGGAGCDGTLVYQLAGTVDDAIYWERAVSGSEIVAIHAAGPNGLTTDSTAPGSAATAPGTAPPGAISVAFSASDQAGSGPLVHDPSGLSRIDLYVQGPDQSGFAKVASLPGATEGSFSYSATAPGTYEFETSAVDAAGNVEGLPSTPDATTLVVAPPPGAGPRPTAPPPKVADFVTAVFVPPYLYLRLKCPARFQPGCVGTAIAVTSKDRCPGGHGKSRCKPGSPMSAPISANQKPNKWKLVKFVIKPQFTATIQKLAEQPDKKLLTVRQTIHSTRFEHGRPQTVFHIYRVRAATGP